MSRLPGAVLLGALALATLSGCDASATDPNVARIDAALLDAAPAGAQGRSVFVRFRTPTQTTDTEAAPGPFPLALATPFEVAVETTDGPFQGETLRVEVRRCDDTCATSEVIGRATVAPSAWPGSERQIEADGIGVTLAYRRTTS